MRPIIDVHVSPHIPEGLGALRELAFNLWWCWHHKAYELFRRIDGDLWEECHHNPVVLLGGVKQNRLEELSRDEGFLNHMDEVVADLKEYMGAETWYSRKHGRSEAPRYAYFSMEYGISESLRTYSGGLGVLAGDHLKSASDLGLPLGAVGLFYQLGYFRQYLNHDGWQQEAYPTNDFYRLPVLPVQKKDGSPLLIELRLFGPSVFIKVWKVRVGRIDLYLLDTNIKENPEEMRWITGQLYGGDIEYRIRQEIVLGIGGLRALHAMGIDPVVCHMNEGHAAFLALERIRLLMERSDLDFEQARLTCAGGNVFTTHTPVPAGFDLFSQGLMEKYFFKYIQDMKIDMETLMALGRPSGQNAPAPFNMAFFAMRNTTRVNAVSRLHGEVTRLMMSGEYRDVPVEEVPITHITNGIHLASWTSYEMSELLTRYLGPRWSEDAADPEVWKGVDKIPHAELWRTHERRRERLVAFVRRHLHEQSKRRDANSEELQRAWEVLDPRILTIGFARRFATYKRATLLLHDIDRLTAMLTDPDCPIQVIFAGKAHPADDQAKELIKDIHHFRRRPGIGSRVVFLEDYDMSVARYLVAGVDVWLNTPRRPLEASGTSGMKILANGGLNCSIRDGWWAEGYAPEVGWTIGGGEEYDNPQIQDTIEANALYDLLEKEIIPCFYERTNDGLPRRWIQMMKESMKKLCPVFNTNRMVMQYFSRLYEPAEEYYSRLIAGDHEGGKAYADWCRNIGENWHHVRILEVNSEEGKFRHIGQEIGVRASISLGPLSPDDVHVEIYGGLLDEHRHFRKGTVNKMELSETGENGVFHYRGVYKCQEVGRHGIGLRVMPYHRLSTGPHFLPHIVWA